METWRRRCEKRSKDFQLRVSTIEGSSLQVNWELIGYPLSFLLITESSKNHGEAQPSKKRRRLNLLNGLLRCDEDETRVCSSYRYLRSLAKCGCAGLRAAGVKKRTAASLDR